VNWPQLILAVVSLAIGCVLIAFNGFVFWRRVIKNEGAPAIAPIFGGVFAAAGIILLPFPDTWRWAWVPLAVDWGGLPFFVVAYLRRNSD
jgi:hypothetical protein